MKKIIIMSSLYFLFIFPYGLNSPIVLKKVAPSNIDSVRQTTMTMARDSVLLIYGDSLYIKAEKKIVTFQDNSIQKIVPESIDYLIEIPAGAPMGIPVAYEEGNEEPGELIRLSSLSETSLGQKIEERYYGYSP